MNKQSEQTPILRCSILDTGYCIASERHMLAGGARRKIACHSLVALLHHPDQGWLLWDTGYAPRMLEATQHFPFSLYRQATPLYLDAHLSVVAQLSRWHIKPSDIRRIIVSHFHADHIAGLRDFPAAEFIATRDAYADIATRQGISALRRAFIPLLLPDDFAQRARLLPHFTGLDLPFLGATHDLFGDGSVLLIALPGHARGQMGMLANTERGRVLFAADSAWLRRSIVENRPPSRLTHFFVDDARAVQETILRLHNFSRSHSDVILVPSHCPEAFAQEVETIGEGHAAI